MDGGSLAIPLFIAFLVLKLTHVITWSWLWVTAPLWVSAASGIILIVLSLAFGFSVMKFIKRRGSL